MKGIHFKPIKRKQPWALDKCSAKSCRRKTDFVVYGEELIRGWGPRDVPLCDKHAEEVGEANPEMLARIETYFPEAVAAPVDAPKPAPVELRSELATESKEFHEILAMVEEFAIEDDEDMTLAREQLSEVKSKYKALEERRKAATAPLNASLKEINGWFKPATTALMAIERAWKGKLAAAKRMFAERQRELAAQAAEAQAQGNMGDVRDQLMASHDAQAAADAVKTRVYWKFEIVDESQIPREFLMPNEKLIGEVVRSRKDQAVIPGVRIFPHEMAIAG